MSAVSGWAPLKGCFYIWMITPESIVHYILVIVVKGFVKVRW